MKTEKRKAAGLSLFIVIIDVGRMAKVEMKTEKRRT